MESQSQMYTCPMHPEVRKEHEGMCPECGMNLIEAESGKKHGDHGGRDKPSSKDQDRHVGHHTESFLKKFWVSLILSIPVVLYSEFPQKLFGWEAPNFLGSQYIPLILGSIVFFYGGRIFLASALRELKARLPGMMTLIALAISVAYVYSLFVTFGVASGSTLFWELTTLITVMLFGHWIEMRAVQGAQGALRELSKLLPDTAEVLREGKSKNIPLSEMRVGDIVLVRPGGRVPADGIVIEGRSEVNETMITGESIPVAKDQDSEVIAGTINGDGALKIKVTQVGEHTFLAGVIRLVQEAQSSKSTLQVLSDRAALYLTVIAVLGGSATFTIWLLVDASFGFATERMVAVLVIACPHALGLAIPLVASISTTKAARNGFLIRDRLALELARKIDIVLFDKTGTLTKGEYGITDIWPIESVDENELLQLAAAVDAQSEHFISKAIVEETRKRGLPIVEISDFARIPGKGVRASVSGEEVLVGGAAMLEHVSGSLPAWAQSEIEVENKKGKTIIYVIRDKRVVGAFALADVIRKESREAIIELKNMGVDVAMVTGDSKDVASWVAKELSIDEYFARVLPGEKSEKVKLLQGKGQIVAMVGDGINDAPALVQADIGIAIAAGTNVAIESAGIILVKDDPRDIVKIIKLSRMTHSKMMQNLFWASGYNVVALPLAAGALAAWGIFLQPAVAALFMSLSTVIVAGNAILLRRNRL